MVLCLQWQPHEGGVALTSTQAKRVTCVANRNSIIDLLNVPSECEITHNGTTVGHGRNCQLGDGHLMEICMPKINHDLSERRSAQSAVGNSPDSAKREIREIASGHTGPAMSGTQSQPVVGERLPPPSTCAHAHWIDTVELAKGECAAYETGLSSYEMIHKTLGIGLNRLDSSLLQVDSAPEVVQLALSMTPCWRGEALRKLIFYTDGSYKEVDGQKQSAWGVVVIREFRRRQARNLHCVVGFCPPKAVQSTNKRTLNATPIQQRSLPWLRHVGLD